MGIVISEGRGIETRVTAYLSVLTRPPVRFAGHTIDALENVTPYGRSVVHGPSFFGPFTSELSLEKGRSTQLPEFFELLRTMSAGHILELTMREELRGQDSVATATSLELSDRSSYGCARETIHNVMRQFSPNYSLRQSSVFRFLYDPRAHYRMLDVWILEHLEDRNQRFRSIQIKATEK